ncbi:unnamed protein product [Leptosia nina]|uniref:Uncharacterized protein n=1 Tax=Leptosia nina TaxID=320188 RepID=A0AAV1J645_9NEOP
MINMGRFKLPPIKNVLDVAMQTVRQQVPEKSGAPPRPPQNVRFANAGKYMHAYKFVKTFRRKQHKVKYFLIPQ